MERLSRPIVDARLAEVLETLAADCGPRYEWWEGKGDEFLAKGRLDCARAIFLHVAAERAGAFTFVGEHLAQVGEYDAALEMWELEARYNEAVGYFTTAARAWENVGNVEEARRCWGLAAWHFAVNGNSLYAADCWLKAGRTRNGLETSATAWQEGGVSWRLSASCRALRARRRS